ncbi:hypothetical protein [Novipirellula herctigrandis]
MKNRFGLGVRWIDVFVLRRIAKVGVYMTGCDALSLVVRQHQYKQEQ